MLVRGSNGSYENIDFRETAPAAATQDMYNNDTVGCFAYISAEQLSGQKADEALFLRLIGCQYKWRSSKWRAGRSSWSGTFA